ncbi:MAG: hypothetical protein A3J59_02520 [Candidatus Buchananbacteria bacterium RIFCSPHIGHO2_02_FULL_56_16]|uniref:Glycosyltransferase RgtA/B/C/D-like domain-containing protein n=1 Tax=Candidatus Buchananbacteria bacterium RIFCSPHIGHO2_02_FULL_56_16 TaxID=1797542 RepID=A0A1G1YG35_9BACT|nr:MAG: hypothetical protein A3J59_02520 [Candidatus Buchananbacteria bacterium RIFCSPHIGHO2_02_FULL_56_16]
MNHFFIQYRTQCALGAIVGLAAFLMLFRLGFADIQIDDAMYSLRALGYLDFVDSNLQTTPVDWFDEIPWWSRLSFHDAPPLVFLIQYVFFKFLGTSVVVARLPFALAGIGSVLLVYLIGKRLYGVEAGLLASFLLAVSTYHTWGSRVGYLEPIALCFILLTILWFLKGLERPTYFIWFGVSAGLMLLTKYTTIFLLPVIFLYLLWTRRDVLTSRHFITGLVIAVALFSPVLFYNVMMFKTRGHFDLQLATLLHQNVSEDWPRVGSSEPYQLGQLRAVVQDSAAYYSLPFRILLLISLVYVVGRFFWLWKKGQPGQHLLLLLVLLLLIVELSFIGSAPRFLILLPPFYALTLTVLLLDSYHYLAAVNRQKTLTVTLVASLLLAALAGVELFFNINTNHRVRPIGESGSHYAPLRWTSQNLFNQLEAYLIAEAGLADAPFPAIGGKADFKLVLGEAGRNDNIFIYDPNLRWFSSLWYFRRWAIYHQKVFGSADDIARVIGRVNWVDFFKNQVGAKNLYFIWGRSPAVLDPGVSTADTQETARQFAQLFAEQSQESKNITGDDGTVAFTIYKISLNE